MAAARLVLAFALSAALLALGPAPALAAWLPPVAASGIESRVEDPQVVVDAAGNATVVWTSGEAPSRSIRSAFRPAGGNWEAAFTRITSTFDCHDPRLAVNAAGAAALVAECEKPSPAVRAAYRPATSWNGALEIAGSSEGNAPRVGIAASGDADVVWSGPSSTVIASHRPASGSWSSGAQISPVGQVALNPNLAVSSAGYAHAIWREQRNEYVGDPVVEVKAARRSPGTSGTWTAPSRLSANFGAGSTNPVAVGEPQVEIGVNGQRMMAWSQQGTNQVLAERTASGDLSAINEPAVFISESGADVEAPRIAVDGSGLGVVTWRSDSGGVFPIKAATTATINGSWSAPPTIISGATTGSTDPALAIDPTGKATAVWIAGGSIFAATRPAAGGAFPSMMPTVISSAAQPGFQGPTVTMTAAGDAVSAWSAAATRVAIAVDDVTPPALTDVSVPAAAEAGSSVAMSAAATDAWSAANLAWDFGDGTTATGPTVSHDYRSAGQRTVTVTATDAAGNTATATRQISIQASPGGGDGGGGTGNGGGSGAGAGRVVLAVRVLRQTWNQLAKAKAIKLRCKLDVTGSCKAQATVTPAVARKIGLATGKGAKPKPVKIGSGSVKATSANRWVVLAVKLTGKARSKLAAATANVPIRLAITASAPRRVPARVTKMFVVHRP